MKGRTYQQKRAVGSKVRGKRNPDRGKREKQSWDFIGIDGEGSTDPVTGKSIYQILHAYSKEYERTIEDRNGLRTLACLDFVLGLPYRKKKLAICGYGFTYDMCNMLADAKWKQLKRLAKDEAMFIFVDREHRYKVRIIYKKLLEVWKLEKINKRWVTTRYARVYDVIGFFQAGFLKTLEDWKIGNENEGKVIDEYKKRRGENLENDWSGWKFYNEIECKLLRDLMLKFNETLEAEDIHISSWWGAGSIAAYWYKQNSVKAHLVQQHDPEVQRDIMYAYFGGQVQTFYRGKVEGPIYHYDICSAYPWATSLLPSLVGVWNSVDDFCASRWALYQVEYDFRSVWEETRYGPLPWRMKKQQIHYPRIGRGIFWAPEVEVIRRLWPDCIRIVRGRVLEPAEDVQPFSWVPPLFDRRNALKRAGDARNIPLKLGLNSLYGKTAQGQGMKDSRGRRQIPTYQAYVWAGLITSLTRARIIEAVGLNPGKVLNVSTDGVFSNAPLDLPHRGKELGNWDEEDTLHWLELYGNGVYRGLEVNHKVDEEGKPIYLQRTRGVEDRRFPFDEFAEAFRRDGFKACVELQQKKYFGYKIAVHRDDPELFNTWGLAKSKFYAISPFIPIRPVEEISPAVWRMENVAGKHWGKMKPDRGFPQPYIPRSELVVAESFDSENYWDKISAVEQPG